MQAPCASQNHLSRGWDWRPTDFKNQSQFLALNPESRLSGRSFFVLPTMQVLSSASPGKHSDHPDCRYHSGKELQAAHLAELGRLAGDAGAVEREADQLHQRVSIQRRLLLPLQQHPQPLLQRDVQQQHVPRAAVLRQMKSGTCRLSTGLCTQEMGVLCCFNSSHCSTAISSSSTYREPPSCDKNRWGVVRRGNATKVEKGAPIALQPPAQCPAAHKPQCTSSSHQSLCAVSHQQQDTARAAPARWAPGGGGSPQSCRAPTTRCGCSAGRSSSTCGHRGGTLAGLECGIARASTASGFLCTGMS